MNKTEVATNENKNKRTRRSPHTVAEFRFASETVIDDFCD